MSSRLEPGRSKFVASLFAALAMALLILVLFRRHSSDGPGPSRSNLQGGDVSEVKSSIPDNPITGNPTIMGSHDRLALLESFASLDRLVIDRCFAMTVLNPKQSISEDKVKLVEQFRSELGPYQSYEALNVLGHAVHQLLKRPADPPLDAQLETFRKLPGGGPILANFRDVDLLSSFDQVISQRIIQLQAHAHVVQLKTLFENHWRQRCERQGLKVSSPRNLPPHDGAAIQRVLRHWELSSTRFVLCISGNAAISKHIQLLYQHRVRPTYFHALNAVLDPAQKRFCTITTYEFQTNPGPNVVASFKESRDGQIALMEFTGAIPRAKLFADWQQGVSAEQAYKILYSPGFNPHSQILLRQDGLPEPDRPAATITLPAVKIELIETNRVRLAAPALEHNAILLLNDQFDPDWTLTIDGHTAEILRANNNVRAMYLEPSKSVRTIEFTHHL